MALSEVEIALARLSNARDQAKVLGEEARRQYMIYKSAKERWLAAVDLIDVRDRELDEKAAIQQAMDKQAEKERRKAKSDGEEMV